MEPMRAMIAYLMMVLMAGSAGGNLPAASVPTAAPTPAVLITANQLAPGFHRMLWRGMKGDDVKVVQFRMIELGYLIGKADGIFGSQTERALKLFQHHHDLMEDGMAGADTLNIMFSTAAVAAPSDVGPTLALMTTAPTLPPPPPTLVPATPVPPTQAPATAPPEIPQIEAPLPEEPTIAPTAIPTMTTPVPEEPTVAPIETSAMPTLAPEEPTVAPAETPIMTTPSPAPPTAQPGVPLVPIVPRPEILVVMDGVVLPVVAVQDAQGQQWLFPCLTLGDILGYTAAVIEDFGSYTYQLARLNPETGETLEEIGVSFSVGEDGQPTLAMLLKDNNVSLLDAGIQLILDQNTLYVPIEFVRQVLGYSVVADGASIQLERMETQAP